MSSAEPATSKLLVQTLNQFRSGIKQMSTKSNTATGWIRGERREGKQEPKLGTLTTPSSTWTDTRGQARRQTGAEAGDTDRPQLNRLTPQPQAVGAHGGGGGGLLPHCWLAAKSRPTLLRPHGLWPARLLCPWAFPGKHRRMGCHFLLQRIFPPPGTNRHLLHCR